MIIVHTSKCCQGRFFFFRFLYNYFLHALGVYNSFLSCLGELPWVNSSAGSNCCTCNCQSTLQAILQELKTMRKLMQFQAGTKKISPPNASFDCDCVSDIFSCVRCPLSHTPSHPAVLLCLFKYSFSRLFNNLWFLSYFIFLANQTNFVIAPNTAVRLMHMNSAHFIPWSPGTSQMPVN